MATNLERCTAITTALIGAPTTLALTDRLGAALAHREGRSAEYAAGNLDAKTTIFIDSFQKFALLALNDLESIGPVQAARNTTSAAILAAFSPPA